MKMHIRNICLVLAMFFADVAFAQTILVVESYHADYPWDVSYKQALIESLGKKYKLEFFEMDTKRLPKSRHEKMADKAWVRYEELKPVLVVLGDDAALKFLGKRFSATETPVVYLGINNNPREYLDLLKSKNITGVLERPLLKRNIAIAHRLMPKAKRVLVLFDSDTTSHVVQQETFGGKNQVVIDGMKVDLLSINDWKTWMKAVQTSAQNYDLIFVGLYHTLRDSGGKHVDSEQVLRWTSAHTPIPLFGFWDFSIGSDKAIGGFVLYGRDQGKAAADIANKILSGTPPARIFPETAERGRYLFSKKKLNKYKLILPAEVAAETAFTE